VYNQILDRDHNAKQSNIVETEHASKKRRADVEASDEHGKLDWLHAVRECVISSASLQSPLTLDTKQMHIITTSVLKQFSVASSWEARWSNPSPFTKNIVLNSADFANSDRVVMDVYVPPSTSEGAVQTHKGKRKGRSSDEEGETEEEKLARRLQHVHPVVHVRLRHALHREQRAARCRELARVCAPQGQTHQDPRGVPAGRHLPVLRRVLYTGACG